MLCWPLGFTSLLLHILYCESYCLHHLSHCLLHLTQSSLPVCIKRSQLQAHIIPISIPIPIRLVFFENFFANSSRLSCSHALPKLVAATTQYVFVSKSKLLWSYLTHAQRGLQYLVCVWSVYISAISNFASLKMVFGFLTFSDHIRNDELLDADDLACTSVFSRG